MAGRTLRIKDIEARTGLSTSTIYDRMDKQSPRYAPDFPKSFPLGGKAVGWNEDEVSAWLLSCKNAPPKATPKTKSSSTRTGTSTQPKKAASPAASSKRKKTPGSLASMILEGGDINARILSYLDMPSWTPAMGVLIVCGIAPDAYCTEIPKEGMGLDDKPVKPASIQLMKARHMLEDWHEWAADEVEPLTELPPGRFLYWCQDSDIDTDWLRLCLQLWGFQDETKPDLAGARFALLTSK
jgi:predicted DNA-binding transcriptional regulator AlpA